MTSQDKNSFFEKLYENTKDRVQVYIVAKCGKTSDIADIFQETYLEVVKILNKKGIAYFENPEGLVMKIAKRKIYKHYSLRERFADKVQISVEENEEWLEDEVSDISFEDEIVEKEAVKEAFKFLKQKDELTRKIFYLHYSLEIPIAEVASLLSLGESNVKNRLYRTLKELKDNLVEKGWYLK